MVKTVEKEDEVAGRVGKGFASEVCSWFPLVVHKNKRYFIIVYLFEL